MKKKAFLFASILGIAITLLITSCGSNTSGIHDTLAKEHEAIGNSLDMKAHSELEVKHQVMIKEHVEIIGKHEPLEKSHEAGTKSDAEMKADHEKMKEDHQKMMKEHK